MYFVEILLGAATIGKRRLIDKLCLLLPVYRYVFTKVSIMTLPVLGAKLCCQNGVAWVLMTCTMDKQHTVDSKLTEVASAKQVVHTSTSIPSTLSMFFLCNGVEISQDQT